MRLSGLLNGLTSLVIRKRKYTSLVTFVDLILIGTSKKLLEALIAPFTLKSRPSNGVKNKKN